LLPWCPLHWGFSSAEMSENIKEIKEKKKTHRGKEKAAD
jgi:hypothetical protein